MALTQSRYWGLLSVILRIGGIQIAPSASIMYENVFKIVSACVSSILGDSYARGINVF